MARNLLSVGRLTCRGVTITFRGDRCTLTHEPSGQLIGYARRTSNDLYEVTPDTVCAAMTATAGAALWHRRYGHLSLDTLRAIPELQQEFSDRGAVDACAICAQAKLV